MSAEAAAFGIDGSAAHNLTTLGALVVTFSVIAMAEVGRAIRFINIAFALSFPKGKIREKYRTFDRYIV